MMAQGGSGAMSETSRTAPAAGPVSATVVIAQRVRPGREADYLRWQAQINDQCQTFPGFVALEVVPPVQGVQDDYVVIFRFDSIPHLDAWLGSESRRALLAQSQPFFASDARQHVVAEHGAPAGASGMVVSTRVKPGQERDYKAWQNRIDAEAARFPGFLGNEIFPPIAGVQDEWVVVVRFDSAQHLQGWLSSGVRKRLVDEAARLWDKARVESFSGAFPGWFGAGSARPGQAGLPPDWKQAMIVLLVLYPTVMILGLILSPRLTALPFAVSMFIGNLASVALLTWLLMPPANRAFGFWLTPTGARGRLVELGGIGVILAGYVLAIAVFLAIR
jgi:antibiotic biosynthesis monooxygenase (ABM) superfamily enzyme